MEELAEKAANFFKDKPVKTFTSGKSKTDLYHDPMLRFAVERQLEVIGEAANHLSENFKATLPEVEWRKMWHSEISLYMNILAQTLNLSGTLSQIKIPQLKAALQH